MLNMEQIFEYLRKEYRSSPPDPVFYRTVETWNDWYRGTDESFHRMTVNNGITTGEREMFRLHMAKKVAEDWANMLLNEKTNIVLDDSVSSEFLQGTDGCGGVFGENDFWTRANRLLEKVFALGTGAVVLYLDHAAISSDGSLLSSPEAKIRLDFLPAQAVIPLSCQGDVVYEAAFVSEVSECDGKYIYLQIHRKEKDGYVIVSRYFRNDSGKLTEAALPAGLSPVIRTGSGIPWFCIFRPNIVNTLNPDCGMGMSVFANSIDVLKGIDLCYDSLNTEFYLGRKMVFMRKDLLAKDESGLFFPPQDAKRQLFMYIGDKAFDGDMVPKEFNPVLRVDEHIQALQQQLNLLSSKCGFGERFYRFTSGTVITATQIVSENSNLYRSIKKHEIAIEKPLISITRAILDVAKNKLGKRVNSDACISIAFDDSVVEDKAAEQTRDLELLRQGVMQKWEFRMKYFGEDETKAKEMTGFLAATPEWNQ